MGDIVPYKPNAVALNTGKYAKEFYKKFKYLNVELPVLDKLVFGKQSKIANTSRMVTLDDYGERSSIGSLPSEYSIWLLRRLYRTEQVNKRVGKFLVGVAEKTKRELKKQHSHIPQDVLLGTVESMLYGNKYSIDTVFGDVWRLLYENTMKFPFDHNRSDVADVVRGIWTSPGFDALKKGTTGDPVASAIVALMLLESDGVQDAFAQAMSKGAQKDEDEEGEGGEGEGDPSDTKDEKCGSGKSPLTKEQQKDVQDSIKDAQKGVPSKKDKDADEDAREAAQQLAGEDYAEPITSAEQVGFVSKLVDQYFKYNSTGGSYYNQDTVNDQLRKTFSLFGRMEQVFVEAQSEARIGDGEMMDITQGDDIHSAIGSEFVRFALDDPLADALVAKRINDSEMSIQKRQGVEDVGNGPILVFLDISGSMESQCKVNVDGTILTTSKLSVAESLALSLIHHAKDTHRSIVVIPFNHGMCKDNVSRFEFSKSTTSGDIHEKLLKSIGCLSDGGTCFSTTLREAAVYLKKELETGATFERSDIVFFSDGYGDSLSDKKQIDKIRSSFPSGTRLFGFFVVESGDYMSLSEVEKQNSHLFDIVKASKGDDLAVSLKEFYTSIVEHGTYATMTES